MTSASYPAIIEQSHDGFSAFFPDLPGCTSAGRTVKATVLNAREALEGHLLVCAEYGDKVPGPSTIEAVRSENDGGTLGVFLIRTSARTR